MGAFVTRCAEYFNQDDPLGDRSMVTSLGLQGWYFVEVLSKVCRSFVEMSKFCRSFVEVLSKVCRRFVEGTWALGSRALVPGPLAPGPWSLGPGSLGPPTLRVRPNRADT